MIDNYLKPGLEGKREQANAIVARLSLDEKAAFCPDSHFLHLEGCQGLAKATHTLQETYS